MKNLFSVLLNLYRFILVFFGFPINPNKYQPSDSDFDAKLVRMSQQHWLYSNCLTLITSSKTPSDEINIGSVIKLFATYVNALLSYCYEYLFADDTKITVPNQNYAIRDCPALFGMSYRYPVLKSCMQYCENNVAEFIIRGPFCHYLKKVNDEYVVDLTILKEYRVKSDVHSLGCKVSFKDQDGKLVATEPLGELDRKILICSMNNHSSLVRHTSAIHFVLSEDVARKSRKYLNKKAISSKCYGRIFMEPYTRTKLRINKH